MAGRGKAGHCNLHRMWRSTGDGGGVRKSRGRRGYRPIVATTMEKIVWKLCKRESIKPACPPVVEQKHSRQRGGVSNQVCSPPSSLRPFFLLTSNLHPDLPYTAGRRVRLITQVTQRNNPSFTMDSHDYINEQNQGFHSPALSASRIDDQFDFEYPAPSPNLPPTPSYNGSYQNSPYTAYSELEFEGNIVVLDENGDYDPSEYDPPSNNQSSLLEFMSSPHVSVTSPAIDGGFEHPFDHGSPASSNGLPDQESESRSRASSVSSQSHSHYPSSPPIQGFESLRFDSPHWNTTLLPADKPGSPSQKPPSPPSLVIPDVSPSMNAGDLHTRAPLINAPQGDGGVINGPQLHIVPATPVSGGVPTTVPFINNPAESTFCSPLISHPLPPLSQRSQPFL